MYTSKSLISYVPNIMTWEYIFEYLCIKPIKDAQLSSITVLWLQYVQINKSQTHCPSKYSMFYICILALHVQSTSHHLGLEYIYHAYDQNTFHDSIIKIHFMTVLSKCIQWQCHQNTFHDSMIKIHFMTVRSKYISWQYDQNIFHGSIMKILLN
jgi:hypothetical protein